MSTYNFITLGNTKFRICLGNDKYYIRDKDKISEHLRITWDKDNPTDIGLEIINPTEKTLRRIEQERLYGFVSVENDRKCCRSLYCNLITDEMRKISTRGLKRPRWFAVKNSISQMSSLSCIFDLTNITFEGDTDIEQLIGWGLIKDYNYAVDNGKQITTKYINIKVGLMFISENMGQYNPSKLRYYRVCGPNDEYTIDGFDTLKLDFLNS